MNFDLDIIPLKPKILSRQVIHHLSPALAQSYGIKNPLLISLGLVTCDFDDALYVALDEATKQANVEVVYAKSFYAGSNHASGPLSGEAIGILAAKDPSEISVALDCVQDCLEKDAWFYSVLPEKKISFFPHVVASCGQYLSKIANVSPGAPLAYLIACPVEALIGIDLAMKSARVSLAHFYGPPTETNFAGAILTGDQTECEQAARVFADSVISVARHPLI